MIRLGHTEIFVKDPVKSREFYEKIPGFELVEIQNDIFIWLKLGPNLFLLRPGDNKLEADEYKNSNTGFVLYTEDLEKTKEEFISRGIEFSGTDGSDQCLTFKDPDGNWFQLVNPEQH